MARLKIPDNLEHDCDNCQGLCCMSHKLGTNNGYPINKRGGEACPNLEITSDNDKLFECRIHSRLMVEGWWKCTMYTCYGAGQEVSKFFKDLGFNWAIQADDMSKEERNRLFDNMRFTFNMLQGLLQGLHSTRRSQPPEYIASTTSIIEEGLAELSEFLLKNEAIIDPNEWKMKIMNKIFASRGLKYDPILKQVIPIEK